MKKTYCVIGLVGFLNMILMSILPGGIIYANELSLYDVTIALLLNIWVLMLAVGAMWTKKATSNILTFKAALWAAGGAVLGLCIMRLLRTFADKFSGGNQIAHWLDRINDILDVQPSVLPIAAFIVMLTLELAASMILKKIEHKQRDTFSKLKSGVILILSGFAVRELVTFMQIFILKPGSKLVVGNSNFTLIAEVSTIIIFLTVLITDIWIMRKSENPISTGLTSLIIGSIAGITFNEIFTVIIQNSTILFLRLGVVEQLYIMQNQWISESAVSVYIAGISCVGIVNAMKMRQKE